jgi:hypothetical protein
VGTTAVCMLETQYEIIQSLAYCWSDTFHCSVALDVLVLESGWGYCPYEHIKVELLKSNDRYLIPLLQQ